MNIRSQPVILISSSLDLQRSRERLDDSLRVEMRGMSMQINPFRWEEETEKGLTIDPSSPIQKQIDSMIHGRVKLTIAMFGERIGEPLMGDLPQHAASLIDHWRGLGLRHPWPEQPSDRSDALSRGEFPLTGTVYELLVALGINGFDDLKADERIIMSVGYVADKPIGLDTKGEDITLNQARWHNSVSDPKPGTQKRDEWTENVYKQQRQGIINLFKALARRGTVPLRFETEDAMVQSLARRAVRDLRRSFPAAADAVLFKEDLAFFGVDDTMPFPDRKDLRDKLRNRFRADGLAGYVLALHGKSGCGKSSLLQKGLLGDEELGIDGAVPVAIRPSDFASRSEPSPLLRFLNALADRVEQRLFAPVPDLRKPKGAKLSDQIDAALDTLSAALEQSGAKLLLGIDQFEEIVDYAGLDSEKMRKGPQSWWRILHFIARAARRERIFVAITLETQRLGRFDDMAIADFTGLKLSKVNVNFESSQVADFVRATAERFGLPLDPTVADRIEKMVEDHESARTRAVGGTSTSSFLPLLALWMHRLFKKFRDRRTDFESDASAALRRAAELVTIRDVERRGITFDLGMLIAELVEDAWDEAGELASTGDSSSFSVENVALLNDFIGYIAQGSDGGKRLVEDCKKASPFDLTLFVSVMKSNGFQDIPGIVFGEEIRRPDKSALENFLGGLVGVDHEGNMRLLEMPSASRTSSNKKLIDAHVRKRLLEPVESSSRVRLIHQAVVDNWPPAHEWYGRERERLILAREIMQAAHQTADREDVDFATLAQDTALVRKAAVLLHAKRATWASPANNELSVTDGRVRRFCLGLLGAAADGRTEYGTIEGQSRPIILEAARYGLADALGRWLLASPELAGYVVPTYGRSLLAEAAWFASVNVTVLLKHGASIRGVNEQWHPIAGAIQSSNLEAIRSLIVGYSGPEDVIGPGGTTMLHAAALSPLADSMRFLLGVASSPDVEADARVTPLLVAARSGTPEIVQLLLDEGADLTHTDEFKSNVLAEAAWSNNAGVVDLIRQFASDHDRQVLLYGPEDKGDDWPSPIEIAANVSSPQVLGELLDWLGADDVHTNRDRPHPLLYALAGSGRPLTQPLTDRISRCVELLLEHGGIPVDVLQAAASQARNLPDARRLIENELVVRADNLDNIAPETVLGWITSDRLRIASAALEMRPDILDYRLGNGTPASQTILREAEPEILLQCLAAGIEPREHGALFRLEAALRRCRKLLEAGRPQTDLAADESLLPLYFPGVDPARLHPVVHAIATDPEDPKWRRLLEFGVGDRVRSVLHRLAVHGDVELYDLLHGGLGEAPPQDAYGRLPWEVAPREMRDTFVSGDLV